MRYEIAISLVLATSTAVPGLVHGTGMFCEPGQDWTTVDSGTITGEGWSVVNFSKPAGGEIRVTWTYEDFDDGPTNAGFWFAPGPDIVRAGVGIYTNHRESGVGIQVDTLGMQADERVTFRHNQSVDRYHGTAQLGLGAGAEADSLYLVQYAAGNDSDGRALSWKLAMDDCLDTTPSVGTASGTDAHLLTAEDLDGTLALEASIGATTAIGNDGARAFVDATATRTVDGTPFLSLYWKNHAGEIQLDGPDGITRETANCYGSTKTTWCLGWGAWADAPGPFTDGEYTVNVTGFTRPPSWPAGATRGPYILYVPTEIPSQPEGPA